MSRAVISIGVVFIAFAAIGHTVAHAGAVYSFSNSLSGTSVQNGWTVAGTLELQDNTVFGTITDSDIKSWQWTATKENTTLSANSVSVSGRTMSTGLNATAAGLYMPTTMSFLFLTDSIGPFDIALKWQTFPSSTFQLQDQTAPGEQTQFLVQPMDFPIDNAYGYQFAVPYSAPSSVPEIDPASFGSVAALLTGAFGLIEQRRRRRGTATALTA
jgi:hypothetical protein